MAGKKDILIMDVTVRDGSYLIDYQYSPEQVSRIASHLEDAGIHYVEVSHGCGLGASDNLGLKAAATDLDYIRAAKSACSRMKVGVIAGPAPTTRAQDISSIIEDVDFIRFAGNCDDPKALRSHINHARRLRPDIEIFFQMMRSSRRNLKILLDSAKAVEDMGVDTLYVVDTVGSFLPEDVERIVSKLSKKLKIPVGFHGHNNLDLAVANSIAAVKAGASIIDASLRGVGRAAGNAQLEIVVSILKKMGMAEDIDLAPLLIAGDEEVDLIMPQRCGVSSLDVITAGANVDIYPPSLYERVATYAGVNFIDLISELGADPMLVEPNPSYISKALLKLGADPEEPIRKAGLSKEPIAPTKKKITRTKTKVMCALRTPGVSYSFEDWMLDLFVGKFPEVDFVISDFNNGIVDGLENVEVLHAPMITPEILSAAKNLKWFHSSITGVDRFVFNELVESEIKVTTPKDLHSVPIAETAIGLMLCHCRKILAAILSQHKSGYDPAQVFDDMPKASELERSRVAIIGLGGIGTELAWRCKSLGMDVTGVVRSARAKPPFIDTQFLFENRVDAIRDTDFVVLACPHTSQTRGLMATSEFEAMKETAYLINIARGELVDEDALASALNEEKIAGAASDVFCQEPLPSTSPLLTARHMIVLPHVSGLSKKYWTRDLFRFTQNLRLYLDGKPMIGEVDFKRGY